ncbi:MAG: hypothetical protein R2861_03260 [Desulfobacterales bacterium]
MHGLCNIYGYSCRSPINSLTPGEPEKVRRLKCRFSRPLYPGDPIKIQIWKTDDNHAVWKTVNAKTGEDIITNGLFSSSVKFPKKKSGLTARWRSLQAPAVAWDGFMP